MISVQCCGKCASWRRSWWSLTIDSRPSGRFWHASPTNYRRLRAYCRGQLHMSRRPTTATEPMTWKCWGARWAIATPSPLSITWPRLVTAAPGEPLVFRSGRSIFKGLDTLVDGWMYPFTGGWNYRWTNWCGSGDELMDGLVSGCKWIDKWMDEILRTNSLDKWMDGWIMDGLMPDGLIDIWLMMDGWIDMNSLMIWCVYERMDRWIDGWINVRVDVYMYGWMDGWIDTVDGSTRDWWTNVDE